MSNNQVELSVRSQLKMIVADLEAITAASKGVSETLEGAGKQVGDSVRDQVKKTETFIGQLRSLSGRVANQLRGDFKTLFSLEAIKGGLKISEQFKGSITEAVTLSDTIRKLGTTFGIASKDFSGFQSKMIKGLGEIGLSSEVASNTLQGLSTTQVRGQGNLMAYSQSAGQLASLSNQKGQEGSIAKGIAEVIRARGGDQNDLKEMKSVSEDLRRVFNATGKGPVETLGAMQQMFTGMASDFRKTLGSRAMSNLAAASAVAGPNSTKFLEEYLSKSPIARQAFDAQGGKGIITSNGIDMEKFAKFSKSIMGRVGGDPRLAAQTLGLSEEAAEGFIRLSQSLEKVRVAQKGIADSTGSVNEQYKASMGLSEAFSANVNRVKKVVATPLSMLTQGMTGLFGKAAGSDAGSVATVAGGGILAALLAGAGMKGVGKGLGGLATGAAVEGLTGRQVQPVYVVNASEIGGGGGVGGLLGAGAGEAAGGGAAAKALAKAGPLMAMLGRAGMVGGAGALGYAAGNYAVNPLLDNYTQGKSGDKAFEGNAIERLIYNLEKLVGTDSARRIQAAQQKVKVELNTRDLKESKQPTRGASF